MEYKHFTIREAMTKICEGKLYLPAIQRKFVWDHDQSEKLFDSIMRDYPIGTFLFWMVEEERFDEYAFYQFVANYPPLPYQIIAYRSIQRSRAPGGHS